MVDTETKLERRLVRTSPDGSVPIPEELRAQINLGESALVWVAPVDGELRIRPMTEEEQQRGSPWLRELYEYFAPVRQEAIEKGYTEEQINGWIDEALAAYRREQDA